MEKNSVITISRQYGSGGRLIGAKLAQRLDIPFYDKEIIELSAKRGGVPDHLFAQPEQMGGSRARDFSGGIPLEVSLGDQVYIAQYAAIRALAEKGPCVVVGRGAGAVLKDVTPLLNVFIYADMEVRKHRAIEEYGDPPHKIEDYLAAVDKKRASYFRFYAGIDGRTMENYHLCIDSGYLGIDGAVAVIAAAYGSR